MDDSGHRCAVLGKPIGHSLSPILHQAAYRALGLRNWSYNRIEMDEGGLPAFLSHLDVRWAGLSLTMPLKRTVMAYGLPCDRWSRELAVANTVVVTEPQGRQDGLPVSLRLYNTDVDGIRLAFAHAWQEHGTDLWQRSNGAHHLTAVILGNGNTALSALAACATMASHVRVVIAARHPTAGVPLKSFAAHHSGHIGVTSVPLEESYRYLPEADIIISTLPAHAADPVAGQLGETAGRHRCPAGATLLDVAYDPRPSLLQQAAGAAGLLTIGGEEMLLYQAILQVRLMTARTGTAGTVHRTAEGTAGTAVNGENPPAPGEAQSDLLQNRSPVDIRLENAMRTALQEAL